MPTGGRRQAAGEDDATSHDDLLVAIGELRGEMRGNFATLFAQHKTMGVKLDGVVERLVKVERDDDAQAAVVAAAADPRATWWRKPAAIAAIIAILGGLSGAYQQALALVVAIGHALGPAVVAKP